MTRVWAILTAKDFFAFRERARADGLSMGAALAHVAHCYARGDALNMSGAREVYERAQADRCVDYIKEHRLREIDKTLVGEEESNGERATR